MTARWEEQAEALPICDCLCIGSCNKLRVVASALEAAYRAGREDAAKVVEKRGREVGGAIDPTRAARAIREEV